MAPYQPLSDMRVVDPILTSLAYGFDIVGYVGGLAFPPVFVPKRAANIISFGTKEQKFLYPTRRAPGANILRTGMDFGSEKIKLYQDAIETELPIEYQEEADNIVDLSERGVMLTKQRLCHRLEYDQCQLLSTFANYPTTNRLALSGANQLSNPSSDIEGLFDVAKQAIVAGIGRTPNTIIYGGLNAYNAVKRHPNTKNQYRYVNSDTVTTDMVSMVYDFKVAGISVATWIDPSSPTVEVPMMDNCIWMGYVPTAPDTTVVRYRSGLDPVLNANRAQPSFGYTYIHGAADMGNGVQTGLIMEPPYYERNNRTWYFPGVVDRLPILTGMSAGYLFTNVSS